MINESIEFNNINDTSDLKNIFTPVYVKQILCTELPIFFGDDIKIEFQPDKSHDNNFVFHEISNKNSLTPPKMLFLIIVENNNLNDGKIKIRLYSRDLKDDAYYTTFNITDSMLEYLTSENCHIEISNLISYTPIVKLEELILTEKHIDNMNFIKFFSSICSNSINITSMYFDKVYTAVKFIHFCVTNGINLTVNMLYTELYTKDMPNGMDLLTYPNIITKKHIQGASKSEYVIAVNDELVNKLSLNENNKYKNSNILNEMINDTTYYIGNTEQMNNALAQANKDEALYAKNNFARHEFIRKVLGNKLYNDILDLGATGTFAPIPLNMIKLTHDDFKKLLKVNGLLDSDDIIIKIYNIIRQSYIRYLFREVNEKIDTDIVFKTFDEVIDFFYVIYHALEKIFLKRVILNLDLKWKPITNKFKDYLV